MPRALVALCLFAGCSPLALLQPYAPGTPERGALESLARSEATPGPAPEPRVERLAVGFVGHGWRPPVAEIVLTELRRCAERLRTRGLVERVSVLPPETEPACAAGTSSEACTRQAIRAYRNATRARGDDGLLLASLVMERRRYPWVLMDRSRFYVTEGGVLEPESGRSSVYAEGKSDSLASAGRSRPSAGRPVPGLPPGQVPSSVPDLIEQSARRFCVDLAAELALASQQDSVRRGRERLLEIEAERQQRERQMEIEAQPQPDEQEGARGKDVDVEAEPR